MQKLFGSSFKFFIFLFVLGAGFTFALGSYIQFHVVSNDFWNILFYGRHMTLSETGSLYNGFFPFGYALLIGQLPFTYVLPLAYAVNALLAGLFTASVSMLVASARSTIATAVAFFASIAAPYVFKNANTLSPDIGSVAFTAFAIYLLWRDRLGDKNEAPDDLRSALIGLSLGMAFLWRTHAIVSSMAVLFGYVIFTGIRPLRPLVLILSTFIFTISLQVIVNLVSGHGALETAQAFNIHKFFYGINDTNPPSPAEIEKFSLIDTIMSDPQGAINAYLVSFRYLISFGWAAATCYILSPRGRISRYSLSLLLFIVVYAIPVSLGDSPRAPIMLMAAYVPSFALLAAMLTELAGKIHKPTKWLTGLAGILFIVAFAQLFHGWILYDYGFIKNSRSERKVLAVIEQTLVSSGMESPNEVFADRFDFYTPYIMPYHSRQIGNWSQDWVWGFNAEFPSLPNDSWNSFSTACKEQGIHYLVLSPNSAYRGNFFSPIYDLTVNIEDLGLQLIAQRGNLRIYMFK